MKIKKTGIWNKIARIVVCICMTAAMALPVYAQESAVTNEAVSNARKGVVEVNIVYTDKNGIHWVVQGGSGFLIGAGGTATTVITNEHVVTPSAELHALLKETFGQPVKQEELKIEVVIKGDVTIGATYVKGSNIIDFAILELEQAIGGKEALVLGTTADLQDIATQKVYALGFPKVVEIMADYVPYTTNDVYVTDGIVSKQTTFENTKMIQHSCKITEGNSGGPLVNEKGVVVGINRLAIEGTEYSSSIQIDDITAILDMLQVPYDASGGTELIPDPDPDPIKEEVDKAALETAISNAKEKKKDTDTYTKESVDPFEGSLSDAQAVQRDSEATQAQVDAAAKELQNAQNGLEEKSGLNMPIILGIGAGILIVIVLIVIVIVVKSSKKKNQNASMGGMQSSPPINSSGNKTTVNYDHSMQQTAVHYSDDGGGETSLLNEGTGATTLLGGQSFPAASLYRISNHSITTINKQLFKIGKEKRKVDFCITDNGSISREHAEIIYKNGGFYIVDKNSSNYTFVNGNKANPGQEMKLANGDRIKLSDEEFEFKM